MTIKLYKTNSDPRDVDKVIYSEKVIECTLKGECSITHPQFMVSKTENGYFNGYNYLYAPELGRFYYINNLTFIVGNYVLFDTSVDVLMSFRNGIRNLNAMIERQEKIFNPFLCDSGISITQGSVVEAIDVGAVTSDDLKIYMTCIGAAEEV